MEARCVVTTRGRLAPRTFASYGFGRRIFLTPRATARPNLPKLRHQNDRSSDVGTDTLSSLGGAVLSVNRPMAYAKIVSSEPADRTMRYIPEIDVPTASWGNRRS